jgi:hypothetical protein
MNTVQLHSLKVIFIHGVNDQKTNYSQILFGMILKSCRAKLRQRGLPESKISQVTRSLVRHEVLWTEETLSRINRYIQLEYEGALTPRYSFFTRQIDPLAMQIMQYIKDKGDKATGEMNILAEVDRDIERFFLQTDVGADDPSGSKGAIIIAHSLGSVIAFDYVFCFRDRCRLNQDVTIHSFITMGSPIPLFTSAMGHPDSDLALPSNVKRWVNILCPWDSIARSAKPFFRNIPIEEKRVCTGFLPLQSHSGYWKHNKTASIIADEILGVFSDENK